MAAAMAATPSFSVKPTATPMAKMSGRLPKITSPEFFISSDTSGGIHSKCAAPMPSSNPATGSTATGQHQRLADLLQEGECVLDHGLLPDGLVGQPVD